VETACFNVHTRVLTLPMWEKASGNVYDLLVAHEVGHALYTPDEDWIKEHKIPPQFVNVVEDVRIEKLMKRRYAGISKSFYRGYNELSDEDFFDIADDDLSTYNLADKANLHFKIGNFVDIPFSEDEEELIQMIGETETFADVLFVSQKLYEFCKKVHDQENMTPPNQEGNQSNDASESVQQQGGSSEQSDDFDSAEPEEGESYGGTAQKTVKDNSGGEKNEDVLDEPEIKTMDSLEEALKNLVSHGIENEYIELPQINLDRVVISNSEVHSRFSEWEDAPEEAFYYVDEAFVKFKRSAQKEVNYLVKEFECRKSADQYSRSTFAKTGVLDTTKLHTYKFNEDLFKKVSVIPDGKNHGLIFILDWSGSMGDVMEDTLKQLYNLIWFCKKVSIPFDVYAFTNEYPWKDADHNPRPACYEKREGVLCVPEWFSMLHLFTHKTNAKTLETQMRNIYRCGYYFSHYCGYGVPIGLQLSGTPLNEALVTLNTIIPNFKKENKLQKVQCVVLTDGEGTGIKFHKTVQRHWENEPYIGIRSLGAHCFLRDRKTGRTYNCGENWWETTDNILKLLKGRFTDTNFIGIRVLEPRDANSFIRRYCGCVGPLTDTTMATWRKTKSFVIKTSGYQSYFALSANALSSDSEFEVSEGATKTQIKSAFVKSLRSKKMNKKILSEFIDLVA